MFKNDDIVNYKACEQCFSQIIKQNQFYCKKCQAKVRYNKIYDRKSHKSKLNKNSDNLVNVLNLAKKYLESNYSSKNLNNNSDLSIIQYTHKADNIHNYEWSNFQKVEQFGDLVIKSKKFPILEYIFRWGNDLQSIPRIQSFVIEYKDEPNKPFGRLSNFDPKTASKSLLSAIYFAGSVTQYNLPEEVKSYMHTYAIINIKKILFTVNISNIQALAIYSYAYYINGNSSLSRVYLSHFTRMGHALGISIRRENLSVLDQHDRKLIYNHIRLYYIWAKLGPSSYEVVAEDNEEDFEIYDPNFQFPNPSLNLCNNEYEATLYSIFCCQIAKINDFNVINISKFCKYDSKRIKMEIEGLNSKANEIYNDAKLTLESVINLSPEYKSLTSIYLGLIKAIYFLCILCINSKMLEISKKRDPEVIQTILDKSIELWGLISSNTIFIDIWIWGPYVVGFHLIQIYPYCSKKQKKSITFILNSIINLFYKEGYNYNTIHFVILKTQFNLINNI
ncbi:hypothetical protein CONCODRAFT_10433 [Conidiobolus coronatus NRRL 28638]|uniref:Transcription factor domain-containing protein n=1 Tax=Conidiobolus coronatus (strain ATCC 28846 / CBS 209.66 / NRRL 28638) TaxID=796925 RepID=A0A137NXU4_CONC2|nr:hypothetical protein CONCODRAFT_10433 [Conidiobolus coronatus NRRL 28638]|eukprot:KXN67491.1 hypothetical protein CONCODRAFT_10433 [Conidiobolus coronatus NRRL 28638]